MNIGVKFERNVSFDANELVTYEDVKQDDLPEAPKELCVYLRNKVQFLTAENGYLKQALDEEKEKFENMRKESTRFQELYSSECKKAKIEEELSKQEKVSVQRKTDCCDSANHLKDKEERIKALSEKLKEANEKLSKSKNACMQLKQECLKARKLLCEEVGEKVTIPGLSGRPGWRGRAEQIQQLQQKVNDLQNRLSDRERASRKSSTFFEVRSSPSLQLEKERKQQVENLAKSVEKSSASVENYKRTLEAAKSRIKVLEGQIITSRTNLTLVNEKRVCDSQEIESLNDELRALSSRFQSREEKMARESAVLQNELQRAQIQLENFKVKLEERDREIAMLRPGDVSAARYKFPCVPVNKINNESATTITDDYLVVSGLAAEAEKERLLELTTVLNQRLNDERNNNEELSRSLRQERKNVGILNKKLKKLEAENNKLATFCTGYRPKLSKSSSKCDVRESSTSGEAVLKFELLEEECLALKTKLATLQLEKLTDLEVYKKMLHKTRQVFQDAARENLKSKLSFDDEKKSVTSSHRNARN